MIAMIPAAASTRRKGLAPGRLRSTLIPEALSHQRGPRARSGKSVRAVPVEPGVRELELVGEGPADRDRLLGLVRDPVVAVVQPQPMPVHGRLDIPVVGYLHGDLR